MRKDVLRRTNWHARHPVNALQKYGYAVLESQVRIATWVRAAPAPSSARLQATLCRSSATSSAIRRCGVRRWRERAGCRSGSCRGLRVASPRSRPGVSRRSWMALRLSEVGRSVRSRGRPAILNWLETDEG